MQYYFLLVKGRAIQMRDYFTSLFICSLKGYMRLLVRPFYEVL